MINALALVRFTHKFPKYVKCGLDNHQELMGKKNEEAVETASVLHVMQHANEKSFMSYMSQLSCEQIFSPGSGMTIAVELVIDHLN